jgi:hypothetical protein
MFGLPAGQWWCRDARTSALAGTTRAVPPPAGVPSAVLDAVYRIDTSPTASRAAMAGMVRQLDQHEQPLALAQPSSTGRQRSVAARALPQGRSPWKRSAARPRWPAMARGSRRRDAEQ